MISKFSSKEEIELGLAAGKEALEKIEKLKKWLDKEIELYFKLAKKYRVSNSVTSGRYMRIVDKLEEVRELL